MTRGAAGGLTAARDLGSPHAYDHTDACASNAMPGPRSLLGGLDGGLDEVHHLTVAGTED